MVKKQKTNLESGKNEPAKQMAAGTVQPKVDFDPHIVLKYPLSTEKSIRQIEFANRLVFVVHSQSTKRDVKRAVETLFKVKVDKVNIQNSFTGQKRAYVRLSPEHLASDLSADLGLI
ncbi:MAG TPA: 50S ribosomal protein L23 [Candidatus Nanoarchaeia archaeon]|nr:50S ribosomal protein L23 [Candidatus Nanoarchaeia archaeon]